MGGSMKRRAGLEADETAWHDMSTPLIDIGQSPQHAETVGVGEVTMSAPLIELGESTQHYETAGTREVTKAVEFSESGESTHRSLQSIPGLDGARDPVPFPRIPIEYSKVTDLKNISEALGIAGWYAARGVSTNDFTPFRFPCRFPIPALALHAGRANDLKLPSAPIAQSFRSRWVYKRRKASFLCPFVPISTFLPPFPSLSYIPPLCNTFHRQNAHSAGHPPDSQVPGLQHRY